MRINAINVAKLIKERRVIKRWSQNDLSSALGFYKQSSGQFISNVERGKCSLPPKKIWETCLLLNIQVHEMKSALVADYALAIDKEINSQISWEGV